MRLPRQIPHRPRDPDFVMDRETLALDGWSREAAAEACAMDRQTLRDWVHRYNESGLEGLTDRPRRNGPRPRLSAEQQAQVTEWVEQGPDLERDGVVRWRCVDLQQRILKEFAVSLHERTVGKLLRKLSFRRAPFGLGFIGAFRFRKKTS